MLLEKIGNANYEDLIFIDGQNIDRFLFGKSGVVVDDNGKSKLLLEDGFMFDKGNNIISKFENAFVPLDEPIKKVYELLIFF